MTTDQREKQAEKVADVVFEKNRDSLFDSVEVVLGRKPTVRELSIAGTSFKIGASVAAMLVLDGFEKLGDSRN